MAQRRPGGNLSKLLGFRVSDMFGWTFDQTIAAAALLTFITLTAGFLAWTAKTFQEQRLDSRHEAEDGALRLLLKILRERYVDNQTPIELSELRAEFEKPERKAERKAYCRGREFRFKDDSDFEQAIYQLQWESKIDFDDGNRILFRTAPTPVTPFEPYLRTQLLADIDANVAIATFENALADPAIREFELESLGRLAATVDSRRARHSLEAAMAKASGDEDRTRTLLLAASALRDV